MLHGEVLSVSTHLKRIKSILGPGDAVESENEAEKMTTRKKKKKKQSNRCVKSKLKFPFP